MSKFLLNKLGGISIFTIVRITHFVVILEHFIVIFSNYSIPNTKSYLWNMEYGIWNLGFGIRYLKRKKASNVMLRKNTNKIPDYCPETGK